MSMIEKAASTLCVVAGDDPDREGPWSEWWSESAYAAQARAVIEALMEPTPEMVEAALPFRKCVGENANRLFQAMLRAALNEGEGA